MNHTQLAGLFVVILAGLCIGLAPVPLKRMRRFQYEHWAFVAMLTGLVMVPWAVTLFACPDPWGALRTIGAGVLVRANLFSIAWGLANILFLQCLVRIGVSLTSGIVGGMTIALGVITPMIFKGTGIFHDAPPVTSPAGWVVLSGAALMLVGVLLAARAGVVRERTVAERAPAYEGFAGGLAMAITAGLLGSGISFTFVYSQAPIINAMKDRGAGPIAAGISVWALALMGGALANVIYPAFLLTKKRSWHVLAESPREIALAIALGGAFIVGFLLMGSGMLLLGVLGASVGFGVQQAVQMLGNQAVGFASGEWRNAPTIYISCAIAMLLLAICILSVGNSMARP